MQFASLMKSLSFKSSPTPTPNDNAITIASSPIKHGGVVDERCIPTGRAVFFDNWPHSTALPSPAQVREAAQGNNVLKEPSSTRGQRVVCFPELQLIVKYGPSYSTPVSEGQTLWLLSFLGPMRVPTLYGWCEDGHDRFIYMERIEGVTLDERWASLSAPQKAAIIKQLHSMVSSMRSLRQAPRDKYIGALCGAEIHEQVWNGRDNPVGPFYSVKAFTDALFHLGRAIPGGAYGPFLGPLRKAFSDNASVVFTHTDLHPGNIIISARTTDVLAIVDWHGSGWYPDFWEYIKGFWTVDWESEEDWKDHIGMFIQPAYQDELAAFDQYEQTGCLI